jgi:hypothetical protein
MNLFDWLALPRRRSGIGCARTAHALHDSVVKGMMSREAWVTAMTYRLCMDMPLLIDSLPRELIRATFTGRDEGCHD